MSSLYECPGLVIFNPYNLCSMLFSVYVICSFKLFPVDIISRPCFPRPGQASRNDSPAGRG